MDQGFINALILLTVSCFICWRMYAKSRHQVSDGISRESMGIHEAEIKATYRRKSMFRLSVMGLCIAAFMSYWFGASRFIILGLLIAAGYCQYHVWQEKTGHFFNDALQSVPQTNTDSTKGTCPAEQLAKNDRK